MFPNIRQGLLLLLLVALCAGLFYSPTFGAPPLRPYPPRGYRHGGQEFRGPRLRGAPPQPTQPPKELVEDRNLRRKEFTSENGTVNYCEFLENLKAKGPAALVLILHGISDRGSDNLQQLASPAVKPLLDYLRKNQIKAVVLVPQCPADTEWVGMLNVMNDLVQAKQKKYKIPTERSVITGFSMGGGACYFFMAKHPNVFQRAIVVSAGGKPEWASDLHGQFFIAVGTGDQVISVENAENLANELSRSNPVRFVKLPDLSHTETGQKVYFDDCWDWAFGRE